MQVAYVGGLGMAFGVNAVTKLGQPAVRFYDPCLENCSITLSFVPLACTVNDALKLPKSATFTEHQMPCHSKVLRFNK